MSRHAERIGVLVLSSEDGLVVRSKGPCHCLRGEILVGAPEDGVRSYRWPKQQVPQAKIKTGGGLGKQGGLGVHSAENGTDGASTVVASTTIVFRYAQQQQNKGEGGRSVWILLASTF